MTNKHEWTVYAIVYLIVVGKVYGIPVVGGSVRSLEVDWNWYDCSLSVILNVFSFFILLLVKPIFFSFVVLLALRLLASFNWL
jgi:hypothetical protein